MKFYHLQRSATHVFE